MEAKDKTSKDEGLKLLSQTSQVMSSNNAIFSWKEEGFLNEVRNQGNCNCCWAIVACAAIESLYNINNQRKELYQLAPQELINCIKKESKKCYLCSINEGFRYAKQYGIRREIDCPFKVEKQPCLNKKKHSPCLRIENFKNLDKEDEDGIIQVLKKQPIGAGIYITGEFENYREGIYEAALEKIYTKCARPGLHAILLIGYGIDKDTGKNFWWIQNSWGTSWGINGYAKVIRNSSQPEGTVPMLSRLSYPENVEQFLCTSEQMIEYCPTRKIVD